MNSRLYFPLYVAACIAFLAIPLWHISLLAWSTDKYSHILIVPFISAYFLYDRRHESFAQSIVPGQTKAAGIITILSGLAMRLIVWKQPAASAQQDWLAALAFVLLIIGGFVLLHGFPRGARFPLLFLALMVPLPDAVMGRIIAFLQQGSGDVVSALYSLLGIPFLREGVVFHLPRGSIEIAQECSGIRSSIALLVLSLIAGEMLLRSVWRKLLLTASILPLVLIKNGIRIVVLSLLGFYVSPSFLTGPLHRDGGILFWFLSLAIWTPWLTFLRRSEAKRNHSNQIPADSPALPEVSAI